VKAYRADFIHKNKEKHDGGHKKTSAGNVALPTFRKKEKPHKHGRRLRPLLHMVKVVGLFSVILLSSSAKGKWRAGQVNG
jgi:hypothetical protein